MTTVADIQMPAQDYYGRLVDAIASADQAKLDEIVRRIRANEDISRILNSDDNDPTSSKPLVKRNSSAGLENHYSREDQTFAMVTGHELSASHAHGGALSEFIVGRLEEPWTTVTKDSSLIEHLLSMYFTWQHSFFQSFPEDLFRSDMKAGRTKYCSQMLVNAICAAGCLLSNREQVRGKRGDGQSLMDLFFNEGIRCLNRNDRSTLTNTAALGLLSYVDGTRGNLSNLWMLGGRGVLMAVDLSLHLRKYPRSAEHEPNEEFEKEQKARVHAFWGCFHNDQYVLHGKICARLSKYVLILARIVSFTLGRQAKLNIHGVTTDLPHVEALDDDAPWEASEMEDIAHKPGARSSTFRQSSELSKIINSTLHLFFAPSVPLSGRLLLEEYDKYLIWYESLPSVVSGTDNAPPHVLCLQ